MNKLAPDIDEVALEAIARALAPAVDRPVPAAPQTWDTTNPKNLTLRTMSTAEYGAWLDAGKPDLHPRATSLPAAPVSRTSGAPRAVSRPELRALADVVAESLGEHDRALCGLRKEISSLKQDGEYFRDTNSALGREMDAMKATVALLKREHELEKQLAAQRAQRRIESLEVALLGKGHNPVEHDDELPGSMAEWRHAQ